MIYSLLEIENNFEMWKQSSLLVHLRHIYNFGIAKPCKKNEVCASNDSGTEYGY